MRITMNMSTKIALMIYGIALSATNLIQTRGYEYANSTHAVVTISGRQFIGLEESVERKRVNVFLGIPYAEPPVGELRFKKPIPMAEHYSPVNATRWPNSCHQPLLTKGSIFSYLNKNFSEDCLYLNIWSPIDESVDDSVDNKTLNLKAVLFFIHGGSLIIGSSNIFNNDGSLLATFGDVVVVTINYRLGPFGFLYLGSDEAPGNVGLWDQSLALQWVNDNIEHFGGDSGRITVMGQSAGGWSASVHMLSPSSRHLFQNAIIMSGTAISNFELAHKDQAVKMWSKVAHSFGCFDDNSTEINVDCLRNVTPADLINSSLFDNHQHFHFGALVYNHKPLIVYGDQFLPRHPIEMLESGDYKKNANLLVGTTEDEGSLMLMFNMDQVRYSFSRPVNISKQQARDEELRNIWSKQVFTGQEKIINYDDVYKLYIEHLPADNYDLIRRSLGIAFGDYIITCKTVEFAKMVFDGDRNGSKVYQYLWSAKFGHSWFGATHGIDRKYCFGMPYYFSPLNTTHERNKSLKIIEITTHFAKYGYPPSQEGIEWQSYYRIRGKIITPYYEIANETNFSEGNFGVGYKYECEHLWNKYIKAKD